MKISSSQVSLFYSTLYVIKVTASLNLDRLFTFIDSDIKKKLKMRKWKISISTQFEIKNGNES